MAAIAETNAKPDARFPAAKWDNADRPPPYNPEGYKYPTDGSGDDTGGGGVPCACGPLEPEPGDFGDIERNAEELPFDFFE